MKSDAEIEEIFEKAEQEIQALCSKYNLTIESQGTVVFLTHHQLHENGDLSVRGREVAGFAPF